MNEEIQGRRDTNADLDQSRPAVRAAPPVPQLGANPRQADGGQQHQSQIHDDHEPRRRAKPRHARNQEKAA